ncbi:MAG: alanine--tRNA ligase, partial [Verrucomicrobiae bacterium]|nr:alanine--tRNA ligase [Verrucomicrobiae bacterium]
CGPCSELHVDLTPAGDSQGKLVNNDSDLCIEIWNLVFIQYNAEADGSFRELPAKHVDTGMGFERACSIIQGTKGFTDFSRKPSNYATDVFQPIFRKLEELSGKTYVNVYPAPGADRSTFSTEMKDAIAFRVIADHLRTLSFAIADGILPGNNGRNYVLRRILRRAVKYGRQLGFSSDKPFFGSLVSTLVSEMGGVFPELNARQEAVRTTLEQEEASFNQTLDRGLLIFENEAKKVRLLNNRLHTHRPIICGRINEERRKTFPTQTLLTNGKVLSDDDIRRLSTAQPSKVSEVTDFLGRNPNLSVQEQDLVWRRVARQIQIHKEEIAVESKFPGDIAFELYDTYGFPVDLTELLCAERGLQVDMGRFETLMEEQRERARAAQKSAIVRALDISTAAETEFLGFDADTTKATVLEVHPQDDALF